VCVCVCVWRSDRTLVSTNRLWWFEQTIGCTDGGAIPCLMRRCFDRHGAVIKVTIARRIMTFMTTHALNHLLPPVLGTVPLRTRGHSYQLPEYSTDLHKKSVLIRSLYSFVKWNSFFWFCCFVLYVILTLLLCLFWCAFVACNKYYIHTYIFWK